MVHTVTVDNRKEKVSLRLEAIYRHIWTLNDQEKSYLDRHFMLVRSPAAFSQYHQTPFHDMLQYWQLRNGGVLYDLVWLGGRPEDILQAECIAASFRYQEESRLAVCLIRAYSQAANKEGH